MANSIHLVVLIPTTFKTVSGGAELQVHYISEYLIQNYNNIRVTVLTRNSTQNGESYTVLRWGEKNIRWQAMEWRKIQRALDIIKPDIIYQRMGNAHTGIIANYCRKHKIPMIWHAAHDNNLIPVKFHFNLPLIIDYIDNIIKNWGLRRSNAIICQTKHQKNLLKKNFNIDCDIVLPNVSPDVTNKLTKDPDKIHVVWVSNFKSFKRPELFLDLTRALTDRNIICHMIGRADDKRWSGLLNKIKETENLFYHGELDLEEVNQLLGKSHVFVNTSEVEGFPNTFLQAWMREVPVVSLSVDPDNIIKKNKLGFHSGNLAQLTKDVLYLSENPTIIKEIGKKARSYCIKNHSMENIERLANLIMKLTNESIQTKI